jgi:hypothetical protein
VLQKDYDAIVAKCPGAKIACLKPYAPNDTTVRGGTYYAFQPNNGNGVHEYAAELAVRYWEEHSALLAKRRLRKPPSSAARRERTGLEGARRQFFAGRDLTPGDAEAQQRASRSRRAGVRDPGRFRHRVRRSRPNPGRRAVGRRAR